MIIGAAPQRPVEFAFALADGQIIDAGKAVLHQAVFGELPVFIAIRAIPVAAVIVPFIGIAHGNTVFGKGPELLDQSIVQFAFPFPGQKRFDCGAPGKEIGTIS